MCSNIPSNNQYYLTSFCDSTVACGSFDGNCNEYYAADYARFGCNAIISCCQGSNCLNLKVIDGGPSCQVEDEAGKPVVDASYSTCKHFTGSTSCGWSDKILVTCKKTSISFENTYKPYENNNYNVIDNIENKFPLGPCSYNKTYSIENEVPICGYDFDINFEEDKNNPIPIYIENNNKIVLLNTTTTTTTTTTTYNADASVSWANSYCAKDSEWECAEFVSRALHAGGMFPGVTDYGNYNGYNLRYVPDLHKALVHYGWTQSSEGCWCGSKGQVLIYDDDSHAALAIGNCLLDQHNPSRCGTNSQWGTNIVLKLV